MQNAAEREAELRRSDHPIHLEMVEAQPAAAQEPFRDLLVEGPLARMIEGAGVPLRFPPPLVHLEEALEVSVKLLLPSGASEPHVEVLHQLVGSISDRGPELGWQRRQVG